MSPVTIGLYKHFAVGRSLKEFSFAKDLIISSIMFFCGTYISESQKSNKTYLNLQIQKTKSDDYSMPKCFKSFY